VTRDNGRIELVKARADVDETGLKEVATTTGGKFYRAADTDALRRVYADIDHLEKTHHTLKGFSEKSERFAWFAIPGLFALSAALGLSATRFRRIP
jgi:Ca-activated chloride channel family protein